MLNKILAALQRLVKADKAVVVGVSVQGLVALAAGLHYHLGGGAVGVLSTIVAGGVGYFLSLHIKAKVAAAKN